MRINTYFDHVYCLSLPECRDRATQTIARAQAFGLSFTFYPAVSGKVLKDVYTAYKATRTTQIGNANYLACAISHLSIYRDALAKGHRRILILEDDLLFHRDLPALASQAFAEVPDQWKLLYLAWIPLTDDLSRWDYSLVGDSAFVSPLVFKARNLWSAMAYGIDAFTMEWMVNRYRSCFDKELDRVFVEEVQPCLPCYGVAPQLFAGYDNVSTNSEAPALVFDKSHDARRASAKDYL